VPRTAPSSTKEHRITLGNYEREQLSAMVERANEDKDDQFLIELARITAMPVAVLSASYLFYLGITNFGFGIDVLREKWTAYVSESKAAQAVVDATGKMAVDVSQGKEGEGGGGGSRSGVYGGSVFM